MSIYQLSHKGEEFLQDHHREFMGSGSVSADRILNWFFWIRETGDFRTQSKKLIEDVGIDRASSVLNWATHKGYLEEIEESEEEITYIDVGDFRVASDTGGEYPITDESHITQLRKNLQKPETL